MKVFVKTLACALIFALLPPLAGFAGETVPESAAERPSAAAGEPLGSNRLLHSAFEMLEKDNPFPKRYAELTGIEIPPRFPDGLPYFFGGRSEHLLMHRVTAWQNSRHFKEGKTYVYGFDCIGYTSWIYRKNKLEHPKSISDLLSVHKAGEHWIDLQGVPFDRWRDFLTAGDLLAIKGRQGNHVMMYIGTLRDFQWDKKDVQKALGPYVDYPLFIHSGINHDYVKRYEKYISDLNRSWIYNTDGGVQVSIVGVPPEAAPKQAEVDGNVLTYFELNGYGLTVYDLSEKVSYNGWRCPTPAGMLTGGEKAKEIKKADRLYTRNEAAAIVEKLEKALLRRNLAFPDAEESGLTDEVEEILQTLLSRHGTDTEVVSGVFSYE